MDIPLYKPHIHEVNEPSIGNIHICGSFAQDPDPVRQGTPEDGEDFSGRPSREEPRHRDGGPPHIEVRDTCWTPGV